MPQIRMVSPGCSAARVTRIDRGNQGEVTLGDNDLLGEGPGQMFAEQLVLETQGVLAVTTVRARTVPNPRIDHHPVARFHGRDTAPDRVHDARAVGAEDVGEAKRAGKALDHEQIEVIQRTRPHRHPHLSGAGLGLGDLRDLDFVEVAGARNGAGEHGRRPRATA
jgi:hypothetical protein